MECAIIFDDTVIKNASNRFCPLYTCCKDVKGSGQLLRTQSTIYCDAIVSLLTSSGSEKSPVACQTAPVHPAVHLCLHSHYVYTGDCNACSQLWYASHLHGVSLHTGMVACGVVSA